MKRIRFVGMMGVLAALWTAVPVARAQVVINELVEDEQDFRILRRNAGHP